MHTRLGAGDQKQGSPVPYILRRPTCSCQRPPPVTSVPLLLLLECVVNRGSDRLWATLSSSMRVAVASKQHILALCCTVRATTVGAHSTN